MKGWAKARCDPKNPWVLVVGKFLLIGLTKMLDMLSSVEAIETSYEPTAQDWAEFGEYCSDHDSYEQD